MSNVMYLSQEYTGITWLFLVLNRNTHNAVKQTAALCLLKMLRVNPKAIPIDQHAAKIVQLINDKHLVRLAGCGV